MRAYEFIIESKSLRLHSNLAIRNAKVRDLVKQMAAAELKRVPTKRELIMADNYYRKLKKIANGKYKNY